MTRTTCTHCTAIRRPLALSIVFSGFLGAHLAAQESLPPPDLPPIVNPVQRGETPSSADGSGDIEAMYRNLTELQKQRRATVADFQAMEQPGFSTDASQSRANRELLELRRQLDRNSASSVRQSSRIRDKMDRLRKLIDKGAFCPPDQLPVQPVPAAATADAPQQATDNTTSPVGIQSDSNVPQTSAPNEDPAVSDVSAEPSPVIAEPTPAVTPVPSPAPSLSSMPDSVLKALSMLDGPVDSLRFANNLYGSGEYQLALEIYQKIERAKLTAHQRVWIEYQIANSHRQLGNKPLAERSYRIVVSQDRDGWIGQNSKWWLDVGDKAKQFEQSVNVIAQTIYQLNEDGKHAGPGSPATTN